MSRYLLFFLLSLFLSSGLLGQDAYHNMLSTQFTDTYNLPAGDWVFFDNEAAILNAAGHYGGSFSDLNSANTDFSSLVRATIANAGANRWDAGWNIRNQIKIDKGDKVLLTFNIRSVGGAGKVAVFAENSSTFAKEAELISDLSEEWTPYFIPFEASQTYNSNALTFGFHLALRAQTVEIGGFTAIRFNGDVDLSTLPNQLNNDRYAGFEEDAPWRAAAQERIDNLRTAQLDIKVTTSDGVVVPAALVQVDMLQHEFAFGSAITADKIAGNNAQNAIYENKIIDLDGKGNGFNWVVFENDLKWPALEEEWFVDREELVSAVQWLRDQKIGIRGHTLVWPGASNMPPDISANNTNLPYIKDRINKHLEDILTYPGIAGNISEWDVLNEITTNRSLEDYFRGTAGYSTGREYLAEIIKKARSVDANTGLWLNDYVTLSLNSQPGDGNYENLKAFTRELLDAGADLEGLGFQGHIGGFPNGIPSVLETLDDFYQEFGLKAKITEFDLPPSVDEALAAKYLRDFMTAIFSHESMDGFLFWSFWDGATYMNPGANLFRMDWTRTPAGDAFVDLVFNQWWTNEQLTTSEEGIAQTQVFKGLYEISYKVDGITKRDTINITEATSFEIIADNITTPVRELNQDDFPLTIFPNPSPGTIWVEREQAGQARIRLFDLNGKLIRERIANDLLIKLDFSDLNGLFLLEVSDQERSVWEKVVIGR